MSIARIAYRITDDGEVVGVTMSRDKAIEYCRDGCEVWTRVRWCCSNGRWYYERRGWKKHLFKTKEQAND